MNGPLCENTIDRRLVTDRTEDKIRRRDLSGPWPSPAKQEKGMRSRYDGRTKCSTELEAGLSGGGEG